MSDFARLLDSDQHSLLLLVLNSNWGGLLKDEDSAMRTLLFAAIAVGAVGLTASTSFTAQAAGSQLAPLREVSIQSDAIEVRSHESNPGKFKSSSKPSSTKFKSSSKPSSTKFKSSSKPSSTKFKSSSKPSSTKFKSSSKPSSTKFKSSYKSDSKKFEKKIWVAPKYIPRTVRWTRDWRHRYYGAYFIVPFGFATYANHYCYDYFYGPYGLGYYWNYDRCPVW
jgi:hypothetical protein